MRSRPRGSNGRPRAGINLTKTPHDARRIVPATQSWSRTHSDLGNSHLLRPLLSRIPRLPRRRQLFCCRHEEFRPPFAHRSGRPGDRQPRSGKSHNADHSWEIANVRTLNCSKTLTKPLLIAAGVATAVAAPAWSTELPDAAMNASAGDAATTDRAVDPESVARANWRLLMAHNSTPAAGCFHASYPNIVWERVACKSGQSGAHSVHARPRDDQAESTGGTDTGNNDSVVYGAPCRTHDNHLRRCRLSIP
jgi:hypothetical protein